MRVDRLRALALLLALGACAEISPASLTGQDDEDDGGEDGDDDDREPTNPGPDGGGETGGDGETCDFEAAVTTSKRVRVLYVVPSDRDEDPAYTANLEQSLRHVQQWFRARMPAATHFSVD